MCRTLKVSKSGFYGWRDRAPSARDQADALLSEKIARIHRDSHETYGAPRIHFELRTLGVRCARKRVARLMREAGLFGCGGRRRKARTTLRSRTERIPPVPDLVKRNFTPPGSGSPLGSRHHVCKDLGGLALPLVRPGHLLQESSRLVHGKQSQDRVGTRCCEHGNLYSPAIARTDPSLG